MRARAAAFVRGGEPGAPRSAEGHRPLSERQAIIVQSFVAAPADAVWAALRSRTDVLFDGLPAEAWLEGGEEQPPFHLTSPWPFTQSAGAPTEVAITLHEVGGGVRVDLRHAGWGEGPAWDAMIQGHFAGWLQGLAALGLLVESGVDARQAAGRRQEPAGVGSTRRSERYFVSGEIPASPSAVYRSLTDEAVRARWSGGVFEGRLIAEQVEDRFVRWRRAGTDAGASGEGGAGGAGAGGGAVGAGASGAGVGAAGPGTEVTAILRATPRGTHLALAEYGVADQGASARWPGMFEALARFLS